jgi:iron complex outermembrane receptor protein
LAYKGSIFLLFIVNFAFAQTDTVRLNEVTIYGIPAARYSAGTKLVQLHPDHEGNMLNTALSEATNAYFKNYGNGQLSTIAFRGTSASQTAVLWNGININLPSLGQTDFSLLPVFLMEEMAVQYGTTSSMYGSDAIGGSVILSPTSSTYEKHVRVEAQQQIGSFGRSFTGAKFSIGSTKLEARSKAYFSTLTNDFPYAAPSVGHEKKQNDASVKNYGFDQQVHWSLTPRQSLMGEAMYTHNFRNIQPVVTSNSPAGTLEDDNTRFSVNYRNEFPKSTLSATLGYILNKETYNVTSTIKTNQLNFLTSMDMALNAISSFRWGVQIARYGANTPDYAGQITEGRYDVFASYRRKFFDRATVSVNLRQSLYASQYAPFSPSVGADVRLLGQGNSKLMWKSQVSRGYRIPTLNDRYWVPGGNPDLLPEKSFHGETGLSWISSLDRRFLSADITAFSTWTHNWIIWLPGSNNIWSPSNLQYVIADGVEGSIKYSNQFGDHHWSTGLNYTFSRSINQKGLNDFDQTSVGKQLPYVPLHSANVFLKDQWKKWSAQFRVTATSLRYTTLDNSSDQSLPAYALLDFYIGRQLSLKSFNGSLRADVNNIFNTYYETYQSHAMPGRNYALQLLINLNSK